MGVAIFLRAEIIAHLAKPYNNPEAIDKFHTDARFHKLDLPADVAKLFLASAGGFHSRAP